MKYHLVATIVFACSQTAFSAQPTQPNLGVPAVVASAAAAVQPITGSTSCSGTFISRSGHFLTALHCLWNYVQTVERNSEFFSLKSGIEGFRVTQQFINKAVDSGLADFVHAFLEHDGKRYTAPKVIWSGRGMYSSLPDENVLQKLSPSELSSFKENWDDYVILKFDQLPFDYACLEMREKPLVRDEVLWSVGFPMGAEKQNKSALVSQGRLIFESKKAILPSTMHESTAGVTEGMSGGAMLDNNGKIVGINIVGFGGDLGLSSSSGFTDIKHIREEMAKHQLPIKEIFNCK